MLEASPHDSDQLELGLPGILSLSALPWGGRSPRALTAGYKRLIFEARAAEKLSDSVDPDQYDLFTKAAPRYLGAPLLISPRWR